MRVILCIYSCSGMQQLGMFHSKIEFNLIYDMAKMIGFAKTHLLGCEVGFVVRCVWGGEASYFKAVQNYL